jgi:hypothetical protein
MVKVGDVNNDGMPDLVASLVVEDNNVYIEVYLNDGQGDFNGCEIDDLLITHWMNLSVLNSVSS